MITTSSTAAPITPDFIGISTNKVGMGTQGSFVGIGTTTSLVFFTSVPSDDYHSFVTDKDNVLKGSISRTIVNVATSSTHGLSDKDKVLLTVKPTDTVTVDVKYDNTTRRIVFGSSTISSTNIIKNTLIISGHDFVEGDKVIYTSTSPITGLNDGQIYYVYPFDKDSIQLVEEKYMLSQDRPTIVDIQSSGSGTLRRSTLLSMSRETTD